MVKTKQLKLRNAPTHAIEAALGKEKSTFELVEQDLPELQDGEVLYQTIFISNDPAQVCVVAYARFAFKAKGIS